MAIVILSFIYTALFCTQYNSQCHSNRVNVLLCAASKHPKLKKESLEHIFSCTVLSNIAFFELRSGECKLCIASSSSTLHALHRIYSFVTVLTKIVPP